MDEKIETVIILFFIRLLYRIPAVFIYLWLIRSIQTNKKQYSGSFYTLFMAASVTNIFVFLNATLFLQLTKLTPVDSFLGSIFISIPDYVARVIYTLSYHFAYVQFITIFYMSLDRFTLLFFPLKHKKIWKRSIHFAIAASYILPLILDYPLLLSKTSFTGIENNQQIAFEVDRSLVPIVYEKLVYFMIITVFVTLICNCATITTFTTKMSNRMKSTEKKLYILSVYNFLLQVFVTVYTYYALTTSETYATNNKSFYFMIYFFGPFVSDLLTFSNPFVLLILMKDMRESLFKKFSFPLGIVSTSEVITAF